MEPQSFLKLLLDYLNNNPLHLQAKGPNKYTNSILKNISFKSLI